MSRHKKPRPVSLSWDEISHYPGIFEPGSEADKWLLEERQCRERSSANPGIKVEYRGKLAEHGLVSPDFLADDSKPIPESFLGKKRIERHFDVATMIKLDARLRFCRAALDFLGFSDEPLDRIIAGCPPYHLARYAAKVLAHYRRAEQLERNLVAGDIDARLGLMREMMLLGETWEQGKFIINHAREAIHGHGSTSKLARGRDQRNTDARHDARQRHAEWQRMADNIWQRPGHSGWSKDRVAKQIKKENPEIEAKQGTIAKKIALPK